MAGAFARVGDQTSGHGPYPPNTLGGPGSSDVLIEELPAALVGDGTTVPCVAPNSPTLNGVIMEGSPTASVMVKR